MARANAPVRAILERVERVTKQTAERLNDELRQIELQKAKLTASLDAAAVRIRGVLGQLRGRSTSATSRTSNGAATHSAPSPAKGKRIRRTPEQLRQEAAAILDFIKAGGSDGVKGGEIRKKFPKIGPDIKGFLQKFSGRKLKTTGTHAGMRYHA